MLELSGLGMTMGKLEAIAFFEELKEFVQEEYKTEDFYQEYGCALNRIRCEIAKSFALPPKVLKAKYKKYGNFYSCRKCGSSLDVIYDYCWNCGTAIKWSSPRCLTKYDLEDTTAKPEENGETV